MKKKMSALVALILFFFTYPLAAAEVITLPETVFDLKTINAAEKIQDTLLNPENFLKRYHPAGAQIKDMSVDKGQFQFIATKKVLIFSKTLFFHADVDVTTTSDCKSKTEIGYLKDQMIF
jgi:hypothetical protein